MLLVIAVAIVLIDAGEMMVMVTLATEYKSAVEEQESIEIEVDCYSVWTMTN